MEMCPPHWDMLRKEVVDQGMGEWISKDGETAIAQLAAQINGEKSTPVNYDPLMACHNMIMDRSMEIAGLAIFVESFGCPICRFNEMRSPEGSCLCDRPDCPLKAPGSVPVHETWLVGPHSCVTASKKFMVKNGWIKE